MSFYHLMHFTFHKMKYWDKVRIKSWFYEGMEGIAIRERSLWFRAMTADWKMVEDLEISVKLEIEWDVHEIVFPKSNLELIK